MLRIQGSYHWLSNKEGNQYLTLNVQQTAVSCFKSDKNLTSIQPSSQLSITYTVSYRFVSENMIDREREGVRLLQTLVPLVLSPKKLWFPFSYNNLIVSCQFTLPKPVLVNNKKEIDLSTSLSANFVSFWSKVCFELTGNSFRRKVNCAVYRRGRLLYNSARTNQPTSLLLTWLISYKKLTVVLFMSTTDLYDNNKQYFFDVLVFLDL